MTDLKRAENCTFDVTLTMTLTLNTKGILICNQFCHKNGGKFEKTFLDLHRIFNGHNDIQFDLGNWFKIKILRKIFRYFQNGHRK